MAQAGPQTYNHDVVGMYYRINRFIEEAQKSQSSSVSLTNAFDVTRLSTYLDSIDRYHAWVMAQPQLDLPETTPRLYQLDAGPDVGVTLESDDLDDIVRMLVLTRDELVNSQSSRNGSGMQSHDSVRLTAIVAKCRAFIESYVKPTTPLDLPESTPMRSVTGPGRTGV